jgi:hypothetical protein
VVEPSKRIRLVALAVRRAAFETRKATLASILRKSLAGAAERTPGARLRADCVPARL